MITFFHTAKANVKKFEDLVHKYNPRVAVRHVVNEELLTVALRSGQADQQAFVLEAEQLRNDAEGMLICTCSTYGEACDQLSGIERIDRPAVQYLVEKYTRIGMAYTAISTATISEKLIYQEAKLIDKKVTVIKIDCTDCWTYFERGDTQRYEQEIAAIIEKDTSNVEAIFLAQASMENVKTHLQRLPQEIMSSPDFGVRFFIGQLDRLSKP